MENWLPLYILLALTFFLALGLEIVRYLRLGAFQLNFPGEGGWRYAYYETMMISTAILGPVVATGLTWGLTLLWRLLLASPAPSNLYIAVPFLFLLGGGVAGLLFAALHKVRATIGEIIRPLLLWSILDMACFFLAPLRWIFGGTLFVLLSCAIGRPVRFTGWEDLLEWVRRPPEEVPSTGPAQRLLERLYRPRRIRFVSFVELEGFLSPLGGGEVAVEESGPEPEGVAGGTPEPNRGETTAGEEKVGRYILDAGRLENLVEAVRRLEERADLLAEIPPLIARDAEKIAEYKKKINREEGKPEKRRELVEEFIRREVFEAAGFGERMRSLLYWQYGLPKERVLVSVSRVPRVRLVPLISWMEYLGLFLGKAPAS